MKTSHITLIILGFAAALLGVFYAPVYFGAQQADAAFTQGSRALAGGDFAEGMPYIRYALEQVRLSRGSINNDYAVRTRNAAVDAAHGAPLQSAESLKLLRDYNIPLACEDKLAMFQELLEMSKQFAASPKTVGSLGQSLYAAALWAQDCKPEEKSGEQYKKLIEIFQQKIDHISPKSYTDDAWFVKQRWGRGYTDDKYRPPVATKEQLAKQPSPVETAKDTLNLLKYTLGRALGQKSAQPHGITVPPAPAAKKETPETVAPKTAPVVQVSTSTVTAEPEKQPEKTPPPAAAEPKKSGPSELTTNLKKPEKKPETKQEKPAAAKDETANAILREVTGQGVSAKTVVFSKDRKSVEITVISESTKKELGRELKALYKIAYQNGYENAQGRKISKMRLIFNDKNNQIRFILNTSAADYQKYLNNEMTITDLVDKGKTYFSH